MNSDTTVVAFYYLISFITARKIIQVGTTSQCISKNWFGLENMNFLCLILVKETKKAILNQENAVGTQAKTWVLPRCFGVLPHFHKYFWRMKNAAWTRAERQTSPQLFKFSENSMSSTLKHREHVFYFPYFRLLTEQNMCIYYYHSVK